MTNDEEATKHVLQSSQGEPGGNVIRLIIVLIAPFPYFRCIDLAVPFCDALLSGVIVWTKSIDILSVNYRLRFKNVLPWLAFPG
jgi:hypothetical protein